MRILLVLRARSPIALICSGLSSSLLQFTVSFRCYALLPTTRSAFTQKARRKILMNSASDRAFNFIKLARQRAASEGGQIAYTFLQFQSEKPIESSLTYEQLDFRARTLSIQLQDVASKCSRVMLLYRPGLAFIFGFLICFYSCIIAVPVRSAKLGQRP